MTGTRVRFVEGHNKVLSELVVDAVDRPNLVSALAEALFDLRVQVVRFETQVRDKALHAKLYLVEFDGAPIRPTRRAEVQAAVLDAVEWASSPTTETYEAHSETMRVARRLSASS